MTLSLSEFDYIRTLVRETSAIALEDSKAYLAEARLSPLARREGIESLSDLVNRLKAGRDLTLHRRVVEAMTTNETSFFRDHHPFETFRREVLPRLIKAREPERRLRFWCGACSSGQEPYSLAITLHEHLAGLDGWDVSIIASDFSTEMLDRARRGRFSQMEVNRGLPAPLLAKYFTRHANEWELSERVRSIVDFRQINLIQTWPALPPMDVILLRNVLIYFESDTKRAILGRLGKQLRPDGFLLLGGSETTLNLDDSYIRLEVERSTYYQFRPRH
jgi:chemotaxis protein methyltransferase CheR